MAKHRDFAILYSFAATGLDGHDKKTIALVFARMCDAWEAFGAFDDALIDFASLATGIRPAMLRELWASRWGELHRKKIVVNKSIDSTLQRNRITRMLEAGKLERLTNFDLAQIECQFETDELNDKIKRMAAQYPGNKDQFSPKPVAVPCYSSRKTGHSTSVFDGSAEPVVLHGATFRKPEWADLEYVDG